MSAEINNREYRQQVLKELIEQLHDGQTVDQVQERFAQVFGNVSAQEIAQAEQALIDGGLPVEEVQRLCDVHASVFKGSIEEIHREDDPAQTPGHPAHTMRLENRALERVIDNLRGLLDLLPNPAAQEGVIQELERLAQVHLHYLKKENLLFPYLEQYGITAPPTVMWGVDDEIRDQLKAVRKNMETIPAQELLPQITDVLAKISEMIFKEENILLPMSLEHLTQDEWKKIAAESGELGYCLIPEPSHWNPVADYQPRVAAQAQESGVITLPTGVLRTDELIHLLDMLPMDITFVDKDDTVKYFSQGAERIFPRTKAVIGRKVSNCHPPASAHIVEELVEDFKAGRKDSEDFWIEMGDKYILIRYFAVRSESGEYLGVLEATQNIRPIQAITGQKRLVDPANGN